MNGGTETAAREAVDAVYRADARRVFATLVRLIGDFDLAEEALHDAFAAALERWPVEGVPARPRAWLVSAGKFRATDALRRRARFDASFAALAARRRIVAPEDVDHEAADDRLRLILTCCHPGLSPEARVALTLREACGLTTEEIARAFLTAPSTVAQRIVRAKTKLRESCATWETLAADEIGPRLASVLQVLYLVFNEGWSATSGPGPVRLDLTSEAIRLGRLVVAARPEPEAEGLLALMLLHDSRRAARTSASGELVLLDDQDRTTWDRAQIDEGVALVERALRSRRFGPYTLQAAVAAVHAEAPDAASTDWPQIVGLYDLLLRVAPSPVVALNRAAALGMRDGPAAGLAALDELLRRGELDDYVPAHASRADLCFRAGRVEEARAAWTAALALARQDAERRYFARRIRELDGA